MSQFCNLIRLEILSFILQFVDLLSQIFFFLSFVLKIYNFSKMLLSHICCFHKFGFCKVRNFENQRFLSFYVGNFVFYITDLWLEFLLFVIMKSDLDFNDLHDLMMTGLTLGPSLLMGSALGFALRTQKLRWSGASIYLNSDYVNYQVLTERSQGVDRRWQHLDDFSSEDTKQQVNNQTWRPSWLTAPGCLRTFLGRGLPLWLQSSSVGLDLCGT